MQDDEVADVAFLAHGTELLSVFHLPSWDGMFWPGLTLHAVHCTEWHFRAPVQIGVQDSSSRAVFLSCRSLSSKPFNPTWWLYPLYPVAVAIFLVLRVFGKPFVAMKRRLGEFKLHVHVIPAWGVQCSLHAGGIFGSGAKGSASLLAMDDDVTGLCKLIKSSSNQLLPSICFLLP
ncbi:sterol desaturase protein [Cymbomonas tetramitiformis]|uniref:Sterol desaturase protein n=1 Tax=Cymbomonas tetramitiformis TaxID=36881 RepID=A0AAE0CCA6_9CHLO|nr:sterol desaturase protein [Cymbomonas tetramitiformis]